MTFRTRVKPQPVQATQISVSRPAPTGGLNAKDPITLMPATDCVDLVNWIPQTYGIRTRKGYREWAKGAPINGTVRTLMSYWPATTTSSIGDPLTITTVPGKLYACTDDGIYDVSNKSATPVLASALSSTLYAGQCSYVNFSNSGGQFLLVCSETDGYRYFDGTTWTTAPAITGVSASQLCFVFTFKRRVWFVQKNSSKLWYLATDAITGAATQFDVGPFLRKGGAVAALAEWTTNAGIGIDDHMLIISELGDLLVYKGTDPASASTWALQGQWDVGEVPKGRRFTAQYGGSVLILSTTGLYSTEDIVSIGKDMTDWQGKDFIRKIQYAFSERMRNSFTKLGWQICIHNNENLLFVLTPTATGGVYKQFVMQTILNSWCEFKNYPTFCMLSVGGLLFGGTVDGRIVQLCYGYRDAVTDVYTGDAIPGNVQTAFDYFEKPGLNKIFHMVRPVFLTASPPGLVMDVVTNFQQTPPSSTPSFNPVGLALWNVAKWNEDLWGQNSLPFGDWQGANGIGYAGSVSMSTTVSNDIVLTTIDYLYEPGGPI